MGLAPVDLLGGGTMAGKGLVKPVAAFWTAAMMLEHLSEVAASHLLMSIIEADTEAGMHTSDLGVRQLFCAFLIMAHSRGGDN